MYLDAGPGGGCIAQGRAVNSLFDTPSSVLLIPDAKLHLAWQYGFKFALQGSSIHSDIQVLCWKAFLRGVKYHPPPYDSMGDVLSACH